MIRIQAHGCVVEVDDLETHRVAGLVLRLKLETLFQRNLGGNGGPLHGLDDVLAIRAIGLGRGHLDALLVAHRHAVHLLLEAGNDLAGAHFEGKRIAAIGAVEGLTALEGTGVVEMDGAAVTGLGHRRPR